MKSLLQGMALATLLLSSVLVGPVGAAPAVQPAAPPSDPCLFPSEHLRFGVTGPAEYYNMTLLPAGAYHNWWANANPGNPNGMVYFPLIRTGPEGYWPTGAQLERVVQGNPGAAWIIGNEADTVWMDNLTPERYAEQYHDAVTEIRALDPGARFIVNGMSTTTPLRLAWLDRVWDTYRSRYGVDMPVDYWNLHTYVVNEMIHEWGPQIPPGFDNVVAFTTDSWQEVGWPGVSGGTVHASREPGARAYFVFRGRDATVTLATGPDAGVARLYVDKILQETVDLYAPVPGTLQRSYNDLPNGDPRIGDQHHVRVEVTRAFNPASSGTWIRVDALEAASTSSLPGGRLEANYPLRARIVLTVEEYGSLDRVVEQVRAMRQWMADHGQRDKPLVNTEFGILIGEDQGFGYPQVRDFLLGSFDRFRFSSVDPQLGMPSDGNRMLQQWFWFVVAGNYFAGHRIHSGLFDPDSRQILPLGRDYGGYVGGLVRHFTDLEANYLTVDPAWPLFAGHASRIDVSGRVQSRGNRPAGPFRISLTQGSSTVREWQLSGLSAAFGGNDTYEIDHTWQPVITQSRPIRLAADSIGQVSEPCEANNQLAMTPPPGTDLALANLTMDPPYFPLTPPGRPVSARFDVEISNQASQGSSANQITVRFWDGDPAAGGSLLHTATVPSGPGVLETVGFRWQGIPPGIHTLVAEVTPAPGETNLANNRLLFRFGVPVGGELHFLPAVSARSGPSSPGQPPDLPDPSQGKGYATQP